MPASRLFTRDFTLMTVGQIISLFGNAILRFALSLHVLALPARPLFSAAFCPLHGPPPLCSPHWAVFWPTGCPRHASW